MPAPGQASKVALIGAFDWARRELIVHTSHRKRSADFIAFLVEIDRRYGPKPGRAAKPVRLVLDNVPIHTRTATRAAPERVEGDRPRVGGLPNDGPDRTG